MDDSAFSSLWRQGSRVISSVAYEQRKPIQANAPPVSEWDSDGVQKKRQMDGWMDGWMHVWLVVPDGGYITTQQDCREWPARATYCVAYTCTTSILR